ncbi:zinc ribbon domain-containing protein [Alcaligenaceae bacterium SJ-26]|nr:zinc ribbon domain-containing protein [Alcaligenaceae bacterium SJ-26]
MNEGAGFGRSVTIANIYEEAVMEPIWKFIIALVLALLAAVIATKRGRAGWVFFLCAAVGAPVAAIVMSVLSRGGNTPMTIGFLGVPIIVLIASMIVRTGDQMAADQGSFRGKRKCPHCAESIRAEAKKCKHCGGEVEPVQA